MPQARHRAKEKEILPRREEENHHGKGGKVDKAITCHTALTLSPSPPRIRGEKEGLTPNQGDKGQMGD